jgi:hypothetical protein
VIVGMYDETEAYAPGAADDFFHRLSETNGTPGKPFYMPNGAPFFCTASGVLLKNGLTDWEKLPPSERRPGAVVVPAAAIDVQRAKSIRRLTKPPAGTLILRAYVRGLKSEKGRLVGPQKIPQMGNLPAEPNRDFMWLQEAEWMALMPTAPVPGHSFPVSDAVRDRICFWHIAGGYHGLPGYYTDDLFQTRQMNLTVLDAAPQAVSMRLTGSAALKSGARYNFHGLLKYNPQTKAFHQFDLIALCDEGRDPMPTPQNVAPFRRYGIAFELSGPRTDDLLPPFYLRENIGTPERYFANSIR